MINEVTIENRDAAMELVKSLLSKGTYPASADVTRKGALSLVVNDGGKSTTYHMLALHMQTPEAKHFMTATLATLGFGSVTDIQACLDKMEEVAPDATYTFTQSLENV